MTDVNGTSTLWLAPFIGKWFWIYKNAHGIPKSVRQSENKPMTFKLREKEENSYLSDMKLLFIW